MLFDYSNRFAVISYRINKFRWVKCVGIDIAYKKTMDFFTGRVYSENRHKRPDLLIFFTHSPQSGMISV